MNRFLGLYILLVIVIVCACKEVGPPGFSPIVNKKTMPLDTAIVKNHADSALVLANVDTSISQRRMALLEEMTGVQCVNCPKGQAIAEKLADTVFQGQLAVIAVHGGNFLTTPFPGEENYDNPDNDAVDAFLGGSPAKPTAAINRVFDSSSNTRFYSTGNWQAKVQKQLTSSTPVKIIISKNYTPATRHIVVKTIVKYNAPQSSTQHLHLYLIEDKLVCSQKDITSSTGTDLNYVHRNVLRKILSVNGVNGDNISSTHNKGDMYTEVIGYTLPANYNPNNCRLVAFVSGTAADPIQLVQAQTTTVQ